MIVYKKWFNAEHDIIMDKSIDDNEIKLYLILNLLYEEKISLNKAFELCTEIGIFNNHWIEIDAKITKIWQNYYK